MEASDQINSPLAGRFIILMKDDSSHSIKGVQEELDIQLTSSQELGSQVKTRDIFDTGNGVYFKNLKLAVVDNIERERLASARSLISPILYWEEEQEFSIVNELEQLRKLRDTFETLKRQMDDLEELLSVKDEYNEREPISLTKNLKAIGIENSQFSGKDVDILMLDSGFYAAHPDFSNRNVMGKSFIDKEPWDKDINGHGTHCIGIAAGGISHQEGLRYGIAFESNIVVGKVLNDRGIGTTSGIIDAIDWAIEKKFDIVSMSFGLQVGIGEPPSPIFSHIGKLALENDCLLVAAAGNNSQRPSQLPRPVCNPANVASIMAVAALTPVLSVASFSNAGINASNGGRVDLSAPGIKIYSSLSSKASDGKLYGKLTGTSMAAPHVSGVAALYREAFPDLSASEIWAQLEKDSKKLANQLPRDVGHGLVQAI